MPLYKNVKTGQERTVSDDYVSAFPAGTWEKLADESDSERVARELFEQEEAVRNKIEVDDSDFEDSDDGSIPLDFEGASDNQVPDELPVAEPHGEGE